MIILQLVKINLIVINYFFTKGVKNKKEDKKKERIKKRKKKKIYYI